MVYFRYCFPFGRPEGALKATLSLLERVTVLILYSFEMFYVMVSLLSIMSLMLFTMLFFVKLTVYQYKYCVGTLICNVTILLFSFQDVFCYVNVFMPCPALLGMKMRINTLLTVLMIHVKLTRTLMGNKREHYSCTNYWN